MGLAVEEESDGEGEEPEKYGEDGGGSAKAEGDPNEPENGSKHGQGENLF